MALPQFNMMLYLTSLGFCLLSISVLIVGFVLPCNVDASIQTNDNYKNNVTDGSKVRQKNIPTLSEFKKVWTLPLQRPLVDPPKVAPKPTPRVSKPRLTLKLHGLIIEPGHSRAIISFKNKETILAAKGDEFWEGKYKIIIKTIADNELTIDYDGELIKIELIKDRYD